jgi:hypothetical protein
VLTEEERNFYQTQVMKKKVLKRQKKLSEQRHPDWRRAVKV